jgi:hypothetical protein
MDNIQRLFQSFTADSLQVSLGGFVLNMVLAAALSFILSRVYVKFGTSLSNRRMFARNFILMAMTTTLIITVVKSSLALSLGLVGALSIVRFRAAIKEPEELSYLFLTIAIGLGLGADQRWITIVAFFAIVGIIWGRTFLLKPEIAHNMYLTVNSQPVRTELPQIVEALNKHCRAVSLKRFDETKQQIEASFLVDYENFEQLSKSKLELRELDDNIRISFLDSRPTS